METETDNSQKISSSKSNIISELCKSTNISAEDVEIILNKLGIDKVLSDCQMHSSTTFGLNHAKFALKLGKNTVCV